MAPGYSTRSFHGWFRTSVKTTMFQMKRPETEEMFQKDGYRPVPSTRSAVLQPASYGQCFLDIHVHVSYTD